jgi:two-component system sensor histidine kinase HydH
LQKTASGLEESLHTQQIQAERIIEIEEQLRRAERLSTVGELAAIMAHEIRNPLSSIKGTAEILKDDFRPGERKYEFLEILVKESNRLNHFVEDFLRLAKPQAITPGRCNIVEQLNTIVTLVAAEAKSRNVRIEFEPVKLPVIEGDEDKLRQAFLNIVLNSLQAAPKGGTVIISATLEGHDGDTARWMNICFTDNGTGVTPEVRQQLFKPFFTTKAEGVGLGLVITKRIVEGHGGTVELKSLPGEGTTFCIRLPLTPKGRDVHGTENSHNR